MMEFLCPLPLILHLLRSHAGDVQSMYKMQNNNIGEGTYGSVPWLVTYVPRLELEMFGQTAGTAHAG